MAYCPNCGIQVDENVQFCRNCGAAIAAQFTEQKFERDDREVPNHLAKALLTTLLCCPPVGFVAIIYSVLVDSKLAKRDRAGALHASRMANAWANGAIIFAVVLAVLAVLAKIIGMVIFGF